MKVIDFINEHGLKGFPESRILTPRKIASDLDEVLSDVGVMEYVGNEKLAKYRSHKPMWEKMCEQLEDAGIPCSIVHRDLRKRNFARPRKKDCETIFFDWGHAYISHPFVTLRQLRDVKGVTEEHAESYLRLWTRFVSDPRELKRLEKLARLVNYALKAVDF